MQPQSDMSKWFVEKEGEGFVIRNKKEKDKTMCAIEFSLLDSIIYLKSPADQQNYLWKFFDAENQEITNESRENIVQTKYIT